MQFFKYVLITPEITYTVEKNFVISLENLCRYMM